MPDYQRVKLVAMPTLYGYDTWWEVQCEACKTPQTASASWAGELRYARKHWATCPALRLQRLLADLEAFARSSDVLSGECRGEATKYSGDPEFTHWQTWSYAHHAYATHVTHYVEKYREAPDA